MKRDTSEATDEVNVRVRSEPFSWHPYVSRPANFIQTSAAVYWAVEEARKRLKQNASLAKSPRRIETRRTPPLFASLLVFVKLAGFKFATSKNPYALKTKLHVKAFKSVFAALQCLKRSNS